MKTPCLPKKSNLNGYRHPHGFEINLKASLPFFQAKPGAYVHRVRSGSIHIRNGEFSHTSIHYWCGGMGFLEQRRGSKLMDSPPPDAVMCATCEGRAIGAGLTESRVIAGRFVRFSPRI